MKMKKTQIASYKYHNERKRLFMQLNGMVGTKNAVLVKDFIENTAQIKLAEVRKKDYLEYVTILGRISSWLDAIQTKYTITINYEKTDIGKAMYIVSNKHEQKNYVAKQEKKKERFLLRHKANVQRVEESVKKKTYLHIKKLQLK